MVSGSIIVCYIGLLILARYMHVSETSITETGIQQSWLSRREVSWEDIQFVKFIPLLASKKMICFLGRGRPVVFQAGTKELQIAFARISLVRSEEHTSELQSLMRISYAVFCLKKKNT